MYLGKVIGNVVSTTKSEKLTGLKLLLVQQIDMLSGKPTGAPAVIADAVGAGVGEIVMVVTGGSSRLTEETTGKPVDGAICGIIDSVEFEGKLIFEKYPKQQEPIVEEPAEKEPDEVKPVEEKTVEDKPLASQVPVIQPQKNEKPKKTTSKKK